MIENTASRDPWIHVLGSMSDGPSGYIEGMEAQGQRQMVESQQMPVAGPWDALLALGFQRGEPVKADDLFCYVTLPEGWTRAGTDHAMHSNILDERGVERVGIFYKAAFYDRRADFHLINPGYSASTQAIYGDEAPSLPAKWAVFTEDERASFVAGLDGFIKDCEGEYAGPSAKARLPRVWAIKGLVQS